MQENTRKSMEFISKLKFKGKWRSYQQRVLDELNYHLADKKLNVVAAPGAGKTTLGIEVLIRLKHHALILSPTITIKNQWKQRIIEGFLEDNTLANSISTDIKDIRPITISTYQALHTLYKDESERKKFFNELKKANIQTLILDEAHHLRTEWYTTLHNLCKKLETENFRTVSLTGTPPYDVSPAEWENYHTLCGPVDAEISIPELVKTGDLCPHQDLIYFSDLSKEESKIVFDFNKSKNDFFKYMKTDSDLVYAINSSIFVNDIENNTEIIYQNTSFTIALISFLLCIDELNMQARILTEFLGLKLEQIPIFDFDTAQRLINGMLGPFEHYFPNITSIKGKLKELKLINGNRVDFSGETDFKNLFARSINKLNSIKDITELEYSNLKENLREVILLDYIGKGDSLGLNIFSVFDKLLPLNINIGILTGTVIIIPKSAKSTLYEILNKNNVSSEKVLTVEYAENYLRVETYGEINIVAYITKLFEKGYINILIGTAALLGEGWDSPSTNTLIIASVVGSFMLSNQMRGRALRIDKNNPDKTANIWHLASMSEDCEKNTDFHIINKRFFTFEGISYNDEKIQNGIDRLNLNLKNLMNLNISSLNKKALSYAKERNELKNKWMQIFRKSNITEGKMTSKIYEIINTKVKSQGIQEDSTFFEKLFEGLYRRNQVKLSKKDQYNIALCLLKTLCDMGKITTPYSKLQLKTIKDSDDNFSITLLNCHNNERNIFINSFYEIFQFDDNLRYILKINKTDTPKYLPIPEIIGQKQENVKTFEKYFKEILLKNNFFENFLILFNFKKHNKKLTEIIFTKNPKNQREVLLAKYNTYISADITKNRIWI